MIYDYDAYAQFVIGILKRVCVVRTEQLIHALMNNFTDMDESRAGIILKQLQNDNRLLMSSDGWTVTVGAYSKRAQNRLYDALTYIGRYRLKEPFGDYVTDEDKRYVDLMWIVVDMLPDSAKFMKSSEPWDILFITKKTEVRRPKLYLLALIDENFEHLQVPVIRNNNLYNFEEIQDDVRTIALFRNRDSIEYTDTSFFSYVCVLDNSDRKHYAIIERNVHKT